MDEWQRHLDHLRPGSVAVLGIPYDEHSSFLRGPAKAPPLIRQAFFSDETNRWSERGRDLGNEPQLCFLGDLELDTGPAALTQIKQGAAVVLARGASLLALGGDHAITYPLLRATGRAFPGLTLLHLDAHPDLYDEFEGDRLSHACPFARIMEVGLAGRLVQVGVRTITGHQRAQAARFGVEMVEMKDWRPGNDLGLHGPLYLSLDLDVLDPAFAPGISHQEPGGMSVRDVVALIHTLPGPLIGADLVEYNPHRDPHNVTAKVAAKLLKEIACQMLETPAERP